MWILVFRLFHMEQESFLNKYFDRHFCVQPIQHFKLEVSIEHLICTGLDSLIWHRGMPDEAWLPPGSWGVLSFFCFSFFLFRPRQRIVSLNLFSLFLWPRQFLRRMKISPILLRQWSWKTPGQWSHGRGWLKDLWMVGFQLFQP